MRTAKLGELEVSRIGLGAMGMSHGYSGAGSDDGVVAAIEGSLGKGTAEPGGAAGDEPGGHDSVPFGWVVRGQFRLLGSRGRSSPG